MARPSNVEMRDAVMKCRDALFRFSHFDRMEAMWILCGHLDLPKDLRPCCPDAGEKDCHGQGDKACDCWCCERVQKEARHG